jgi:glycosyltransferase involved in cell wall biosynthesis
MARILVLSNMYPPHHLGGYELSCRDVTERLRARGHEPTILTTTFRLPDVADPPRDRELGIRRRLAWYWDDHVLLKPPVFRRLQIERDNQRAMRDAMRDARPEVAFVWHMGAMSLGLLTTLAEQGVPTVFVVCDDWLVYGPNLDPWTKLFLGRPRTGRVVRRLTGVPTTLADLGAHAVFCFVSEATKHAAEQASVWKPRISTVVYSGIDRRDFPAAPPMARPWRWRLLSVGRLDERKGIHVAVEALTHLPQEATLEILGRGDAAYERRLRALADELGLSSRVLFGSADRERLRDRYAAADVVVFPTLWDEPFGLVPLEAMACRTPVVATGTGGSGEFLHHEANCLLIPQRDAAELAAAVRRLEADAVLRSRLIEGGLRTADELDVDRLTDVLEEWVVAAASSFAGGRPADRRAVLG